MNLGQTNSAGLYYPVVSNLKTSWEALWQVRLTSECCKGEKCRQSKSLRILWLWDTAVVCFLWVQQPFLGTVMSQEHAQWEILTHLWVCSGVALNKSWMKADVPAAVGVVFWCRLTMSHPWGDNMIMMSPAGVWQPYSQVCIITQCFCVLVPELIKLLCSHMANSECPGSYL